MGNNKRGLGRGLGALIPQGSVLTSGRTVINLDLHKIVPNNWQPRTVFAKDKLHELTESIKEQGVIEPILVRQKGSHYELVAGERRWRAAKAAGLSVIPAIIKDFSDEKSLELALIENLQREDLNPLDEAEGYARLIKDFNLTQDQVAKKVSKNRSTVANMLRLLALPDQIKESIRQEKISVGHARALLAVTNPTEQLALWHKILAERLNVRDVEVLTGTTSSKPPRKERKQAHPHNVELNHLVEQLTTHLGTKVKIFGSSERGKIEINYYSKEDLERLFDTLLNKPALPPAEEIFLAGTVPTTEPPTLAN